MRSVHTQQIRGVYQRGVITLNAPAIGVVESRVGNHAGPGGQDLLGLTGGRQNISRVAAAAKRLVNRDDLVQRDAPGLGRGNGGGNDVVVSAVELGLNRVRI